MAPSRISPSPEHSGSGLTTDQLEFWDRNGYLILPDALDENTVRSLLSETKQMLEGFSLSDHPMTKFSTGGDKEGGKHVGDEYFLTSGDKIRFFFEQGNSGIVTGGKLYLLLIHIDAFDANGKLQKPKDQAVNKIGHYLHELSPAFKRVSLSPRNVAIARSLNFRDPRVLQSMVICKHAEVGGKVPVHQDSTFLYTNPPSAVGFWYALQDATIENGCLSFANGSHKRAPISKRFVRSNGGTSFMDVDGAEFPKSLKPEAAMNEEDYTIGEVKAGTLVLIHGNILHRSEKNTSQKSRNAYTFHVIEAGSEHVYDEKNWLQPPEQGFSRLFQESC